MKDNAYKDLKDFLQKDEKVEAIVFGPWGWDGYEESEYSPPEKRRNKVLTLRQAKPFMQGWSFYGGYGAPSCPAVYIWTNIRVIWVTEYDGSTTLNSAPRNPCECKPEMPGG